MVNKSFLTLLILSIIFQGCQKENLVSSAGFDDSFDLYSSVPDIFSMGKWTFHEQTYPQNTLTLNSDIVHNGIKSIRMFAVASDGPTVSKSGLASHSEVLFNEGDVLRVSCWFYIPQNDGIDKLVILDLEDPAPISSGPGIRLMFDPDNALFIERNKMGLSNITQPNQNKTTFTYNQWNNIVFELKLSTSRKGYVKLLQNGVTLIEEQSVKTMPKDRLYITQGTSKTYRNVEVGITANSTGHAVIMFIDNFSIQKLN